MADSPEPDPEAQFQRYAERLGIPVEEGGYKAVLEKGLSESTCRSFSDAREYAMSLAWKYIKEGSERYLSGALERAWDELRERCREEFGVTRVGGRFPGRPRPTPERPEIPRSPGSPPETEGSLKEDVEELLNYLR